MPVLLATYHSAEVSEIEYHDDALGWHALEAVAGGCAQVVGTAQLLQVARQLERLLAPPRPGKARTSISSAASVAGMSFSPSSVLPSATTRASSTTCTHACET
eukprot:6597875-Prymnesium_polylepis.1